jgi:hypothetical protein
VPCRGVRNTSPLGQRVDCCPPAARIRWLESDSAVEKETVACGGGAPQSRLELGFEGDSLPADVEELGGGGEAAAGWWV